MKNPNKSHRKIIQYPSESKDLAELMGVVFGDGGINNPWQLVISMNSIADKDYSIYCKTLLEKLFQIDVTTRKRPNQNTLVLVCSSTNLVDFLVSKGATRGNKVTQNLDIPRWIIRNNSFSKAFVKGLTDTDGCLYIHKHNVKNRQYSNIGYCLTNYSSKVLRSVKSILERNGIAAHISKEGRCIYLYKNQDIKRYLEVFETSNPRINNKYLEWRDAGVV